MAAGVFLDRDGVINQKMAEGTYVTSVREFHIFPGVVNAIARLKNAGYLVFIVTNQRGIALGLYTMSELYDIHTFLLDALKAAGVSLDGIYVCPHDKDCCNCRKPKPGLLLQAKKDFPDISLRDSVMIGDSESDIQAGVAAGCGCCIRISSAPGVNIKNLCEPVDLFLCENPRVF